MGQSTSWEDYRVFHTKCPSSIDPSYIVSYYIIWVTTSWTYSILPQINIANYASFPIQMQLQYRFAVN